MTLLAKPPYDFVRDYSPVALVGSAPLALIVHASLPVKSVKDFVALARAAGGAQLLLVRHRHRYAPRGRAVRPAGRRAHDARSSDRMRSRSTSRRRSTSSHGS